MKPVTGRNPLRTAFLWIASLAALAAGAAPITAQDPTGGPGDPFLLPDLVVTATRVPVSRGRLPTPVAVLSGERIRQLGIRTVAEALRQVPGLAVVSAASAGSQTSVFVRGGESDYVKVLLDGVPLNEAGGAIDFADLSTDQIERIEVVRGPASVLYGSDAVSGVVQIFTQRGRGAPRLDVTALGGLGERRHEDGRHGVMEAEATLSGSVRALSYTVGGGHSWSAGTYPLNNENMLETGSLRLAWNEGGASSVALATRVTIGEFHYPTDGGGNIVDENQAVDRRGWTTSLFARRKLSDVLAAEIQVGHAARDQVLRDDQDGPEDTSGVFASLFESEVHRSTADARLTATFDLGIVTLGGSREWLDGEVAYDSDSEFGPYDAQASFERSNTAAYVEALVNPTERLQATLGFRTDHNETFGRFDTHRIGVSWSVLETTRVRGALGRAFREPTFAENFGSGFGDIGGMELVPERTRGWEVGVEHATGPFLLQGTWFDQTFNDLIQFTFATSDPADPNYVNVGGAKSSGLELAAEGTVGSFALASSYTLLETEVVDPGLATDATFVQGQPLLRRPRNSGSLSAQLVHARGSIGVVLNLVGQREDVDFGAGFPAPRVTLSGYRTLDLSADYLLPVWEEVGARLLMKIENVIDADYEAIVGFPAPGRVVRVGAKVSVGG